MTKILETRRAQTLLALLFGVATTVSVSAAHADTCSVPYPLADQGDAFYMYGWGCNQTFINDLWSRFDFQTSDWDDGFGYDAPCNNDLPLARTFNALMLMGYSYTNAPVCSTSDPNVLVWGLCWAGNQIDELNGRCGSWPNGDRAYTQYGWFVDAYTDLYFPFFYGEDVVQRAGTIFHEARHASWCSHSANNDECARGKSCETSFYDGCGAFGDGMGANGYQVRFLEWFAVTATWTTPFLTLSSIVEANNILGNAFKQDPCFRLASDGYEYSSC
jgi:hypothetical protein